MAARRRCSISTAAVGSAAGYHPGGTAGAVDAGEHLVQHAGADLGQPQAAQVRDDDPAQCRLVAGQRLWGHRAVVVPPRLAGHRGAHLLAAATYPVLPQLGHGHVRFDATEAQRAALGEPAG